MTETILIIILTVLVIALALSIVVRHRRLKGKMLLSEGAINELVLAMVNNAKAGRIQDIAGKVSFILKNHLGCEKIVFLKSYKGFLELNYYVGIHRFNREEFKNKLTVELQSKLKSFHKVVPLSELIPNLPPVYIKRMEELGLSYFFPVYLRESLYGVYFIATDLPPENTVLQFLATALAFNLSTAYHIGAQEQQISRYEDKLKALKGIRDKGASAGSASEGNELMRFLKIRDSKQLIPELLTVLRKDCEFSKMAFYVQSDSGNEAVISVNWNLDEDSDRILRENFRVIADRLQPDRICDLRNFAGRCDQSLSQELRKVRERELKYLTAFPWVNKNRAVLAWSGSGGIDEVAGKLQKFRSAALPLVDNIRRYEKVEELSYTDGLTGMYNFRFFQKRMAEEFARAKRYGRNLALLIFDIDDLKAFNDKYGHLAGDSLLKAFGRTLSESVRSIDVISRYGGDEFCLIMPETNRGKARQFMERIREKIVENPWAMEASGERQKYSVSIGGAVFPEDADSIDSLINAADMALLKAKSEGRNCSKLYLPEYERKT